MLPAFNTIYQHYADEVARLAEVTIETGSAVSPVDDDYGPESLIDDNPAKVAKIEDTTGAWLFEYDTPQVVELFSAIHHNFDETDDAAGSPAPMVRLQANNINSWSAPLLDVQIVIPPWFSVGTRRWPVNPWVDLTSQSGYDAAGFLFYRLLVENNSQNLQLGMVWFGSQIRRFDPDLRWGPTVGTFKPQIENRTSFEVATIYSRGTTIWQEDATLHGDDDMAAALELHWHDVGAAQPWLIVPSGPISDDRAYLVRYATTAQQMQWNFEHSHDMQLSFREVGRGLRPGV